MNRIYLVTNVTTGELYLRIATSPSQALKSIVTPAYTVNHVNPLELYLLQEDGVSVENAVPDDVEQTFGE